MTIEHGSCRTYKAGIWNLVLLYAIFFASKYFEREFYLAIYFLLESYGIWFALLEWSFSSFNSFR